MSKSPRQLYTLAAMLCVVFSVTLSAAQAESVKKYTEKFTDKFGDEQAFDMVLVPAGKFMMGSDKNEPDRQDNEGPRHEVQVDSFYLCTTETTLKLFLAYYEETNKAKAIHKAVTQAKKEDLDAITGPTPVFGELTMGYPKNHPAMGATWHNAVTFCKWLSKYTGKTYRLPTEAEWEYAMRAGSTTLYPHGDDPKQLKDYAWFDENADAETHPVASKKPNKWGIYDMAGNVREWVYDFYSPAGYKDAAALNPKGPETGKVHVARGGDYNSLPDELRSASRAFEERWWRDGDPQIPKSRWWLPNMDMIGFRIARSVEEEGKKTLKFESTATEGEYTFDTGVLKGILRQGGKSRGLSSVIHIPTGLRLDGSTGIVGCYRVFSTNNRFWTAGWAHPSKSELLPDGAVRATWPQTPDRPFELTTAYRITGAATIDVRTTVKARKDLPRFEVFLSSYFNKSFPSPNIFVSKTPDTSKPGFMLAERSLGDWQMYPRDADLASIIKDGRWTKEPHPVDWTIMPDLKYPLAIRKGATQAPVTVLMAPADDCYAISTPYDGEGHYSLYLSLFGRDIKAGKTDTVRSRFSVTQDGSEENITGLYKKYIDNLVMDD